MCAALSARESGARVLVLERAPQDKRGGNSAYTGGGFRMVHHGAADIKKIVPDLTDDEIARTDFGEYSAEQYLDDLGRITQYYIDPDLAETIVKESTGTVHWMRDRGIRFMPNYGRQAYNVNGRFKFFGGVVIFANGGGTGLMELHYKAAEKHGIEVRYQTRATALLQGKSGVEGVRVTANGVPEEIRARAVVLACGGFEANREMRTRYLGPGWDMAKVRGTRYNTGDGISMALEIGAQSYGQWSGCHSVAWERYAPDFGDVNAPHAGYRHSYPFGIMVNADGRRFVDEGADFRNYTYAKYGRVVLAAARQLRVADLRPAGQAFDARRIQAARRDQGAGRDARRPRREDAGRASAEFSRHRARLQRGDQTRGAVRSQRQGRPHHRRPRDR